MLEIILVVWLAKSIGRIVKAKGRRPGWYITMLVAFWIIGELAGAVAGAVIAEVQGGGTGMIYLFALLGAAAGAGIAFVIAKTRDDLATNAPRGFGVVQQQNP